MNLKKTFTFKDRWSYYTWTRSLIDIYAYHELANPEVRGSISTWAKRTTTGLSTIDPYLPGVGVLNDYGKVRVTYEFSDDRTYTEFKVGFGRVVAWHIICNNALRTITIKEV